MIRGLELTGNLQVYWNSHIECWSVRNNKKVVLHAKELALAGPITFKVSEAGRQRVLREKRKNVHAYVSAKSNELHSKSVKYENLERVYYDPYVCGYFYRLVKGRKKRVDSANGVLFRNENCYADLKDISG